ncbi:MAG: hypothetical protein ACOCQQ_03505 [Candidatus Nanoarchaeia archaeon]
MTKIKAFGDPIMIRYRGLYDYDGLMTLIRNFFSEYQYIAEEPTFKYKKGGGGVEVTFKIKAFRELTIYIISNMKLQLHAWDLKRKQVEIDGKQKTMTGGKVEILIEGDAQLDYTKMFDEGKAKNQSRKKLLKWMQSRLDDPHIGLQFGENHVTGKVFIQEVVLALSDRIKEHLNMECY